MYNDKCTIINKGSENTKYKLLYSKYLIYIINIASLQHIKVNTTLVIGYYLNQIGSKIIPKCDLDYISVGYTLIQYL